ncbi:MAG: glycosyltransferase family 4 protein [Rhodobacteraceae bacterium]|jgi:glycosyltransferase involved in cell wall biosynthesis|nr:glycosyltransferase family 4 protein [Paracoccaceae bacterium]
MKMTVLQVLGFTGIGPAETCYRVCSAWVRAGHDVTVHTSFTSRDDPQGILRPVVPAYLPDRISGRILRHFEPQCIRMTERRAIAAIRPGEIFYAWTGSSNAPLRAARAADAVVVTEFINTHIGHVRRIMDSERQRVGLGTAGFTDADVAAENERLALADFAFTPGPFVAPSIEAECPDRRARLIETSYGATIPPTLAPRDFDRTPLRFLFVGTLCVRKGVHTLLEAWKKADLPHWLDLAGGMDPEFAPMFDRLATDRVRHLGYLRDIARAYAEADVFVFPSIEEGGPQVVYEAAAHGLPMIVTPMGGGRIATPDTAEIVGHSEVDGLAAALVRLASDPGRRARLSAAARAASVDYAWDEVARQRLDALTRAMAQSA